jgi:predicted TPR repeat methyltransferase
VELCEEWLARRPGDPHALHTRAACSGRDVPPRASDAYVQVVFDSFAESFEAKLAKLHYRAPELVAAAVAGTGIAASRELDVVDLGCGTGLCGLLLAPYARRLVGVDLSEGMLKHASEKHLYDELVQVELTAYLRQLHEAVDLIVSADTLVYFGDLEDVVAAAARALRPGGTFIFTVEEAVDGEATAAFCIQPHGRYNHLAEYVERVLAKAGLQPTIERAELRKEYGLPVAGLVVRGHKPVSSAIADVQGGGARPIGAQHG